MTHPDYRGGSIVNLMQSVVAGLGRGAVDSAYPPHRSLPPALLAESRHVVLMVIDGLGHDYLRRKRPGGAIASLSNGPMTSVFPSTTASAVTTFLTADAPKQHALTGWFMWLREFGVVAEPLPFRIRAGERNSGGGSLRDAGLTPESVFGREPVFDLIRRERFMVQPAHLCSSVYSRAHQGAAVSKPYRTLGGFFSRIRQLTASKAPSYIYAYWPELDTLGHHGGMESAAAEAHLAEVDARVEGLLEKIRGRGVTLVVTADHGFVDTTPGTWVELENHPQLKAMLAVPLCGEPRAAYCYLRPGAEQDFVAYVRERLAFACELLSADALLDGDFYGLGEPHPRLHERIGHYCLVMRENFAIRDGVSTKRRAKSMIGVHGGTSEAEMKVPLAIAPA